MFSKLYGSFPQVCDVAGAAAVFSVLVACPSYSDPIMDICAMGFYNIWQLDATNRMLEAHSLIVRGKVEP